MDTRSKRESIGCAEEWPHGRYLWNVSIAERHLLCRLREGTARHLESVQARELSEASQCGDLQRSHRTLWSVRRSGVHPVSLAAVDRASLSRFYRVYAPMAQS